jgi:Na+/proline symporter
MVVALRYVAQRPGSRNHRYRRFYPARPNATLRQLYRNADAKGRRAILTQNLILALNATAFGIYILYVSAAQVRRLHGAEAYLRPAEPVIKAGFGLGAAAALYGVLALFVIPWMARESGLAALYMALTAITAPLLAIALGKRFWIAKELLGARRPADMLGGYFGRGLSPTIWALAAFCVYLPLLALAMTLAGNFAAAMTGGAINRELGAVLLALLLALGTAPAGLAASASMGRVHGILIIAGIAAIAAIILDALGGASGLAAALAELPSLRPWGSTGGRGGGAFSQAYAVAGFMRPFSGLDAITGQGAPWTGATVFSMAAAFAGLLFLLSLPWLFANPDPRLLRRHGFGPAGLWMGLALFAAALLLGIGGLILAAPTAPPLGVAETAGAFISTSLSATLAALAGGNGWKGSIIALTGLAALHAFAGNLVLGTVAALSGFWTRRTAKPGGDQRELGFNRIAALATIAAALLISLGDPGDLPHWGGLAFAAGLQLCVPLAAICWWPVLPGRAASLGLVAGLATVLATTPLGYGLFAALGGAPWTVWPQGMHPALWGLGANLAVCLLVIWVARDAEGRPGRDAFHRRLLELGANPEQARARTGAVWFLAALWIFFALGPGTVIGNDIFGNPGRAPSEWDFGVPSILAWQLVAWVSGLALLVYVSRRTGLAQFTAKQIAAIKNAGRTGR